MDAASGGSRHDGEDGNLDDWDLEPFWNTVFLAMENGHL